MSAPKDVEPLWYHDFWDGPISGVALYQGRLCWFSLVAEADSSNPDFPPRAERVYDLFDMTDTEARDIVTQHIRFERYVGCHTCYHVTADGKRDPSLQWWQRFGKSPADSPFYANGQHETDRRPVSTDDKKPLVRLRALELFGQA